MRAFAIGVGALAALLPAAAHSATVGEQAMIACAAKPDPGERLACYDRAVSSLSQEARALAEKREAESRAAAAAAAALAAQQAADAAAKQEAERLSAFGRDSMSRESRPPPAVESLDRVEAKIAETLTAADGKLIFVLDNGQMWRQTEGLQLPPVRAGNDVVVKKGAVGGFALTIVRIGRTVRVVRMR
jgi:hypothetical protein